MKKIVSLAFVSLVVLGLSGCGTAKTETVAPATGSLWKSTDGGKKWSVMYDKKISIIDVDSLNMIFNPFDANNFFVGLKGTGILKTENGGEAWTALKFNAEKVYGLAIDPVDSRIVYASGVLEKRGKIFKTMDAGENWEEIYTSPATGPLVVSLTIDPKNPKIIYAATSEKQVMKSEDGGGAWRNIYEPSAPVIKFLIDQKTGVILMLDKNGNVLRSSDGGKTFEDMSSKISTSFMGNTTLDVLELDQLTGWIYVAGKDGILRSKDHGTTWEKIQGLSKAQDYPVRSLAINPKNSNELMYGAGQTVYKSVDGGNSWSTSQFDVSKGINVLKYNPQDPSIIYIGMAKL